jgi:hypothetical protein
VVWIVTRFQAPVVLADPIEACQLLNQSSISGTAVPVPINRSTRLSDAFR